jgi:GMP synthase-like glutamine amidotransferase
VVPGHGPAAAGEAAWGVQFHPEVTREILLSWFASYRDDPDAVAMGFDPQAAEAELAGRLAPSAALGRTLLTAFMASAGATARPLTAQSSS